MQNAGVRPAGYSYLIERYALHAMPVSHASWVSPTGGFRITRQDGRAEAFYPLVYWPGDSPGDHLEFALKYDGVELGVLAELFDRMPDAELTAWIAPRSTSKYARRIWFLYEFLTGRLLPIPDLTRINYVDVLEPEQYFVDGSPRRIVRQRVMDNLLGPVGFCPTVRKTEALAAMTAIDIRKRCEDLVAEYPADLLRRAMDYLYTKETKSSFQIENITPSATRAERFVALLASAERRDFCEKRSLLEVQNQIVDPRFQETDYRKNQNYVGQSVRYQKQIVHYVSPRPEDLPGLMAGLIECHSRLKTSGVPAVVHAAVVSYGFVFLHPFADGNGRIHRFLIHNILSLRGQVPEKVMFPVSAAMLRRPSVYDRSLEVFSKPLLERIEYSLDEIGQLTVKGDTGRFYRTLDLTSQAEALYGFIQMTLEEDLVEELDFLSSYDRTKRAIQAIVDMPDAKIDLFVHLCLQNQGRLSHAKREDFFSFLSDEELNRMEAAVRDGYSSR